MDLLAIVLAFTLAGVELSPIVVGAILTALIPPIVQAIRTPETPRGVSLFLAGAFSLVVGGICAWVKGDIDLSGDTEFDMAAILQAGAVAFAGAKVFYELQFKTTTVGKTVAANLKGLGFDPPPTPQYLRDLQIAADGINHALDPHFPPLTKGQSEGGGRIMTGSGRTPDGVDTAPTGDVIPADLVGDTQLTDAERHHTAGTPFVIEDHVEPESDPPRP